MALRDLPRAFENLRARIGNTVGSGPGAERPYGARILRLDRRRALALAALVALIAVGIGGYAIGASQVVDVGEAEHAGMVEGQERGTPVGAREGYASAFASARERTFEAAYREAYRRAYLAEFEKADLAAPRRVVVRSP